MQSVLWGRNGCNGRCSCKWGWRGGVCGWWRSRCRCAPSSADPFLRTYFGGGLSQWWAGSHQPEVEGLSKMRQQIRSDGHSYCGWVFYQFFDQPLNIVKFFIPWNILKPYFVLRELLIDKSIVLLVPCPCLSINFYAPCSTSHLRSAENHFAFAFAQSSSRTPLDRSPVVLESCSNSTSNYFLFSIPKKVLSRYFFYETVDFFFSMNKQNKQSRAEQSRV